jgi:predicted N-acyltransferase
VLKNESMARNDGGESPGGGAPRPSEGDADNYVIRVFDSPGQIDAIAWNALLAAQPHPTPFMRHEYLAALHDSGSATPATGWVPNFLTLWQGDTLAAGCPLYLKDHSYGEYVFDWAWANAYAQHGLAYYPKALVAVPFTPVPGTRLLACDAEARLALLRSLIQWCEARQLSSLHLLFAGDEDLAACDSAGLLQRHTVQFHWKNLAPTLATACASLPPEGAPFALGRPGGRTPAPRLATACASLPPEGAPFALGRPGGEGVPARRFGSFEEFLASLTQEKRKKIRQERRKVAEAGVTFRWARGADIRPDDWDFFYRCYERTYLEHGNAPYLTRDFFQRMADDLPQTWLLFVAERAARPIASSLIALHVTSTLGTRQKSPENAPQPPSPGLDAPPDAETVAYGRYWGALERVDCLHFEACYYQPLQWCIEHGVHRFEGGAQGEHKMARALLPVRASSAHWLAHPGFADAVARFLQREGQGVGEYLDHLQARSPLRKPIGP